jgi:SecD/SecF fusion protein
MQNKGFIRVFGVLLGLVCVFYLSFSFVTARYNKQAAEYANGDVTKESFYLDSLAGKKVWLGYTLKQCREMEVTLGLDLKGGMNVILELNVPDVIRSLSNHNQDPDFNRALELAYARQATSQRDFIDLFVEEYRRLDPGARLSAIFSTFDLKDKITSQSTDAQVISVIREAMNSSIETSFNVLRTRIDRFGVVSPNIQRLETAGRILVELPGVKEPERVRKLLQGSANLEFWETYDLSAIYQQIVAADEVLARILKTDEPEETDVSAELQAEAGSEEPAETALSEAESLLAQIEGNEETSTEETLTREEYAKSHPLFAKLQLNTDQSGTRLIPGAIVGC